MLARGYIGLRRTAGRSPAAPRPWRRVLLVDVLPYAVALTIVAALGIRLLHHSTPPARAAAPLPAATTPSPSTTPSDQAPATDSDTGASDATPTDVSSSASGALTRPESTPVHLTIAAIGVDAGLEPLTKQPDGTLPSPPTAGDAGWYTGSVVPGDVGSSVIAGHIDSSSGPAVFNRLSQLRAGDTATITTQDGTVLTFVVDSSAAYPKGQFPTQSVYGTTDTAQLRLITYSGDLDPKTHKALQIVVVSAHLQ